MKLPEDYLQRVYAGVLGKIIGVYIGRPFEGWTYEHVSAELGEVRGYVNEHFNVPLIVTDDDITGTFTFIRALADHGFAANLSARQIGQSWLNYLIENKTILWWSGMGNSTEHTAYLRLKHGIPAPRSGSAELNGKVVAEQIGAQIFIDGWAMVCPGDPHRAVYFAGEAARVSHDGEAVYAAQLLAAMEALAFVVPSLERLQDEGLRMIPADSVIARLTRELRDRREKEADWRKTRAWLDEHYGYRRFGGNVHVVPNHGLIQLSLLYGGDDFNKTMMIVNSSGWDTDCNAGNVGCLLGIKNGLACFEGGGVDWRGPVADRLYLPTADGGRAISDAAREALEIANMGRRLVSLPALRPKGGARFHFELPGSLQGFSAEDGTTLSLRNAAGYSRLGKRSLELSFRHTASGQVSRAGTPVFIPALETKHYFENPGYQLLASPAVYPGQTLTAWVSAAEENTGEVEAGLYLQYYDCEDQLQRVSGPSVRLLAGEEAEITWKMDDRAMTPIAWVGIEISSAVALEGKLYLDALGWQGSPDVEFVHGEGSGEMRRAAWVDGLDQGVQPWDQEHLRLVQNEGRGLVIQGAQEWQEYRVCADVTPHLAKAAGLAARVQGMRRYYALLLCEGQKARLVKVRDDEETVLAQADFDWQFGETASMCLEVKGHSLQAAVDGRLLFSVEDSEAPLDHGAVGLVVEEGRTATCQVRVSPVG